MMAFFASDFLTTFQIVEQLHLVLQSHYSTVVPFLTSLSPEAVSTARSSEDILLAHLIFKCLVKCAVWLWQKLKSPQDKPKVDPWVSCGMLFH